jgi:hypothetical protein
MHRWCKDGRNHSASQGLAWELCAQPAGGTLLGPHLESQPTNADPGQPGLVFQEKPEVWI